jgi:pyruvate-formate lyase-activating enzyme
MINTTSLCNVCYKKIPAKISIESGAVHMHKKCNVHGEFSSLIDKDAKIFTENYNIGTEGINKAILVPVTDRCNMSCSWCFTKGVKTEEKSAEYYDRFLVDLKISGYSFLLTGGEPTERKDFFEFCKYLYLAGWPVVTMTNMINFADELFVKECFNVGLVNNGLLHADFSMQHPKNYSGEIAAKKFKAITNLEKFGIKANCVQFSISSLDELWYIREFFNDTKHLYHHIRIRTMFGNWKDSSDKIFLSDLHNSFVEIFGDLSPIKTRFPESSNIYSLYFSVGSNGFSLSSGPTVENVDMLSARRPTHMLALDERYYSFPVAQIVNEGIHKGWYNGFKLEANNA